eukprot:scaffold1458_cov94-Skeletonema_dohrnii-CCMP3373.AAC.1
MSLPSARVQLLMMLLRLTHVVFSMFVLSLRRRVLPTHLVNLCSVCDKLLSKRSLLVHDDATIATAVATMLLHAVDEGFFAEGDAIASFPLPWIASLSLPSHHTSSTQQQQQ